MGNLRCVQIPALLFTRVVMLSPDHAATFARSAHSEFMNSIEVYHNCTLYTVLMIRLVQAMKQINCIQTIVCVCMHTHARACMQPCAHITCLMRTGFEDLQPEEEGKCSCHAYVQGWRHPPVHHAPASTACPCLHSPIKRRSCSQSTSIQPSPARVTRGGRRGRQERQGT